MRNKREALTAVIDGTTSDLQMGLFDLPTIVGSLRLLAEICLDQQRQIDRLIDAHGT